MTGPFQSTFKSLGVGINVHPNANYINLSFVRTPTPTGLYNNSTPRLAFSKIYNDQPCKPQYPSFVLAPICMHLRNSILLLIQAKHPFQFLSIWEPEEGYGQAQQIILCGLLAS